MTPWPDPVTKAGRIVISIVNGAVLAAITFASVYIAWTSMEAIVWKVRGLDPVTHEKIHFTKPFARATAVSE